MRAVIAGVLARHVLRVDPDPAVIEAAIATRQQRAAAPPARPGGVALIPVRGVIAPHMNLLSEMSGGTDFDSLTRALHAAAAERPKAIVLDVDSPGGNVAGATEFAREVLKVRAQVPVIAQVSHLMGSAAYWFGACATEIVASPSSLVGAVGVYTIYDDVSKALEAEGVTRHVIAAGEFKGEGVDGGPLSAEARTHREAIVGKYYASFLKDVAAGRGVSVDTVRATYGKGRVLDVDGALQAGMITRVGTLADTLDRLGVAPAAAMTEPAPALARATAQEPATGATAQERAAIIAEQLSLTQRLIEMSL